MYWSIIEAAVRDGCEVLDFGRSTPNEGTYKFKEQWGALPVPLHWEYPMTVDGVIPDVTPANPKFRIAIELWKKLPLSFATRFGPRIVRSIP
jgi:lipid II:glycine glycyltransferase (peptidoglycan interpeptide bridge formation enzyme)